MNEAYFTQVTDAMVDASYAVLPSMYVEDVANWSGGLSPSLVFVRGRGKATNHVVVSKGKHRITFGWKMVKSKLTSKKNASLWTTGREIVNKGYMDGVLTPTNALVHTILHEYAHFHQTLSGGRYSNSVHNQQFYRCLNKLYRDGADKRLLAYFQNDPVLNNLKDWVEESVDETVGASDINICTGDYVEFNDNKGKKIVGYVKRVNSKTLTVVSEMDLGVVKYRVPIHIAKKVGNKIDYSSPLLA